VKQTITAILFVGSLLVVGGGAFFAGRTSVGIPQAQSETPATIVEEAKQSIPAPTLPPRPAGRQIVEMESIEQSISTPAPTWNNPGRTQTQIITIQVPRTRLIDAYPEQIDEWNSRVAALQSDYNRRLSDEISRISRAKNLETARDFARTVKEISSEVIAPLILALAGIIGAIVSLRAAFKIKSPD
jgi:hypothetical protein